VPTNKITIALKAEQAPNTAHIFSGVNMIYRQIPAILSRSFVANCAAIILSSKEPVVIDQPQAIRAFEIRISFTFSSR
jgi:hypothetical protein